MVSLLEGISYLVILSVTLGFISRDYVFPLGMVHGLLFIAYLVLSLQVSHKQGWSLILWLPVFFAAVIPFAFVGVDFFLQREMRKSTTAQVS